MKLWSCVYADYKAGDYRRLVMLAVAETPEAAKEEFVRELQSRVSFLRKKKDIYEELHVQELSNLPGAQTIDDYME